MFFTRSNKKRPGLPARSTRVPWRPQVEALEDRCLLSAGLPDPTFGTNGVVTTALGSSHSYANSLAIQSNGKIIAAGYASYSQTGPDFALVRYTANGKLDSTFGSGGVVTTDFGGADHGAGLVLQGDGKLVVAGVTMPPNGAGPDMVALARYNANGSLDASFGSGGKVTNSLMT